VLSENSDCPNGESLMEKIFHRSMDIALSFGGAQRLSRVGNAGSYALNMFKIVFLAV